MIYEFGRFVLDEEKREFSREGIPTAVEPKVFDVLLYLVENRERAVGREELFAACWPDVAVSGGTLSRCLSRVRLALGQPRADDEPIRTLHRKGYRFVAPVVARPSPTEQAAGVATPSGPVVSDVTEAHAPAAPEADRRYITVMDCRLSSANDQDGRPDAEILYHAFRDFYNAASQEAVRLGGVVAWAEGDRLQLHFGAPKALERAAEAAAITGRRLVDLARVAGLAAHVGLSSGTAIVGRGAGAGGAAIVLRLDAASPTALAEAAGPGEVLLDPRTGRLVAASFRLDAAGAELGGAYRLGLPRPPSIIEGEDEPFVGRFGEREHLRQLWSSTKDGRGQIAAILGQAGLGKSRLIGEFCADVELDRGSLLPVTCSPHHKLTPFHPLLQLMRALLGIDERTSHLGQLSAIETMLGGLDQPSTDHLPILASLLADRPTVGPAPTLRLDPARQRDRTLESLVALVGSLAKERPKVLWIEDMQWADPTTKETMRRICERVSSTPFLILLSARDEADIADVVPQRTRRIALKPFTSVETGRFLNAYGLPERQVSRIAAHSDGVPLFLREFVRMAAETENAGEAPQTVPETLRSLLQARLDQLGNARDLCEWAACIGRIFERDLLAKASGLDEEAIEVGLERLQKDGIVVAEHGGRTARLRFTHQLVCDAAYDLMLFETRRERHVAIADALIRSFPEIASADPERVAYHYDEAGMAMEATAQWHVAGRASAFQQADEEARATIERMRASSGSWADTQAQVEEIEKLLAKD
ncbi:MAG: AAA family ATPase [Pseudomonadota bacterium]